MEHSFLSFGFTTMVFYGVISIPLYIATIVIIIRKKTLNGSFYTIYIASGIAVRFFRPLRTLSVTYFYIKNGVKRQLQYLLQKKLILFILQSSPCDQRVSVITMYLEYPLERPFYPDGSFFV